MKKILVPTDFSMNADNAFYFAIKLASGLKAEIILFHAFDIQYPSAAVSVHIIQEEIDAQKTEIEKKLKKLELKAKREEVFCSLRSEYGLTVDSILKIAAETKADMIVMGTRGAGKHRPALFGTNTTAIIEKAACPVFCIPEGFHFEHLQNIVLATNYDRQDIKLLGWLISTFSTFNPNFSLLHVTNTGESHAKENMELFAAKARVESGLEVLPYTIMPAGDDEKQIETFLTKRSSDLIVVSPREHSFFGRLFGNSLSDKLAGHIQKPLLCVPR